MTRDRVTDSVGVALLALAAVVWWVGLPVVPTIHPALVPAGVDPLEDSQRVVQVARQAWVALLLTIAMAALGVVLTRWRSASRAVFVAPLLLVLGGLAAAQVVRALVTTRTEALRSSGALDGSDAVLAGLAPQSAIAAVLVASVGAALLLAGVPPRPLAVVAALLAVAAGATIVEEGLLWWLAHGGAEAQPARYLAVDSLGAMLIVVGALALATGVRAPAGSFAREAAVGAIVLWGAVLVVLRLLSPVVWDTSRSSGLPRAAFITAEPYAVGVLTLLAAPAAALLVARMRTHPGREAVTARWRGASAALAFLMLRPAIETIALLMFAWPGVSNFITGAAILWVTLSVAAGAGFALAASRRDAGPPFAVAAAALAVASVAVGPGLGSSLWTGGLLPELLVLNLLAPLVVAGAIRRGQPTEPTEPTEPAVL
jgi:hypothetical protein